MEYARRLPVPGEWVVGAVGVAMVAVGCLYLSVQSRMLAPTALLRAVLIVGPGVGVVGVAAWLAASEFGADLTAVVAWWCLVGLGSFLVLTLLIELNPGGGTDEPVPAGLVAASVGALAGCVNGINQSRAVHNAREAERARTAAEMATRQNERLDELASAISHDVQSPVRLVRSYLQLARRRGEVDATAEAYLADVEAATDRLDELLSDLKTLTHHGQEVTDPELLSFEQVVEDAWELALTGDADLDATVDGVWIPADETRLKSMLVNLFENAVEHGDASVVEVGQLADGRGFYVADDGTGIRTASTEKLFESGYTTDVEEGTGFGLAIVDWVATAHGWEIDACPAADGGARFEVTGVSFDGDARSGARSVRRATP